MVRILSISILVMMFSSWANTVLAGDYHVEIIVFKNMTDYTSHDNRNYNPPADIPSFASHWEATEYKLEEQLEKIQVSDKYQVLLHHAWQQESLPYSESAAVEFMLDPEIHNQFARLPSEEEILQQEQQALIEQQKAEQIQNESQETEVEAEEEIVNQPVINQAVSGWIKVYAKTLLFAELDLEYFGYRIQEKRRLLLDDVHFLDHPKVGILLQVSRVEKTEEEEQEATKTDPVKKPS